mmetsp:Transcript_66184/g.103350  ORF Transcript_66184/g.103350 Transcript_66184/m.103350 type:complete len:272 (+) Transcript_66184:31-846(+)
MKDFPSRHKTKAVAAPSDEVRGKEDKIGFGEATLRSLKPSELLRRAVAAGATHNEVEMAIDDEKNSKEALIALVLLKEKWEREDQVVDHQVWGRVELSFSELGSSSDSRNQRLEIRSKFDCSRVVFHPSSSESSTGEATASDCGARGDCPDEEVALVKEGLLEDRGAPSAASSGLVPRVGSYSPSWSMGAAAHGTGICKPCAWVWKPRGCSQGSNCLFCHLCDAAAHKQFRRERLAGLKANRSKRKQKLAEQGFDAEEVGSKAVDSLDDDV